MFKRLFKKNPIEVIKRSKLSGVAMSLVRSVMNWTNRDKRAYIEEGYKKNAIVFQAINKTATYLAGIPWVIKDKNGNIVEGLEIEKVLNRPNLCTSRTDFLEQIVSFYRITGDVYLERSVVGNRLAELFVHTPVGMETVPGRKGIPLRYEFHTGQGDPIKWPVDQITGQSDMHQMKTFHPETKYYGMSPLEPGGASVDMNNEAVGHMAGLYQNGGYPTCVVEVENEDNELSDEEFNRFERQIDNKLGAAGRGRPFILEGGAKLKTVGFNPQTLDIINGKDSSARDIALALDFPPILLGIQGDSTYSNYQEARIALYDDNIIPLAKKIVDNLNFWLQPFLEGNAIHVDLSDTPSAVAALQRKFDTMKDARDLTPNERREFLGYSEYKGADVIYIKSSEVPIDSDMPDDDGDESLEEVENLEDENLDDDEEE